MWIFFLTLPLLLFFCIIGIFLFFIFHFSQCNILSSIFARFIPSFLINKYYDSIGDLRDDINDSWSADIHKLETEEILTYLFDLQNAKNSKQVYVTILSGDIHSAGYSSLYSPKPKHSKYPIIYQIVSSSVAHPPFPWWGEALYRSQTNSEVRIGQSYTAQIAHHFTQRNVVICSVRNYGENHLQLKVKFYIEGYSEPHTSVFALEMGSHLENIKWANSRK